MRLALFYILLIAIQGFLGALLSPIPPPDLFLLAVLTLLWRVPPWSLVLIAYGVGLLQDVIGGGVVGFHAFGLAAGAVVAVAVRAQLTQSGPLERAVVIGSALVGKWLVLMGMFAWLAGAVPEIGRFALTAGSEALLTGVAALIVMPWGDRLLERVAGLRKELL